jgi:hypothetical protein
MKTATITTTYKYDDKGNIIEKKEVRIETDEKDIQNYPMPVPSLPIPNYPPWYTPIDNYPTLYCSINKK